MYAFNSDPTRIAATNLGIACFIHLTISLGAVVLIDSQKYDFMYVHESTVNQTKFKANYPLVHSCPR